MALRIELKIKDVTLAEEGKPLPETVPERKFSIQFDLLSGYLLSFDGRQALVDLEHIQDLRSKVIEHSLTDWQHSREPDIRATFEPLNRIVSAINSTPSYQLFLAGLHIADTIGAFDLEQIEEPAIEDSFRYLVGNTPWATGKQGRLFFLPDSNVSDDTVREELLANGKIIIVHLFNVRANGESHIAKKVCVPYATPIGFNTSVSPQTEREWTKINRMSSQRGSSS